MITYNEMRERAKAKLGSAREKYSKYKKATKQFVKKEITDTFKGSVSPFGGYKGSVDWVEAVGKEALPREYIYGKETKVSFNPISGGWSSGSKVVKRRKKKL